LPRVGVVRACSLLNAFLRRNANSNEVLDFAAHRALVKAYFPPDIALRILELERASPRYVAFHRQQLLFVVKEALQYAGEDPTLKLTNSAFGEVLLIANDHMHFEICAGSSEDSFVKLASSLLPIQEAVSGNLRHKLIRSFQMTKAAPEFACSKPYFDVSALFKAATELNLQDFYALVLAAMTRFSTFKPERYLADPLSYSLDEHWFSSTKVAPESIQAFFKLISASPEDYLLPLKTSRGPNDFTALRDRPLLRSFSKLYLLDYWMLAEKFESGPFWEIHSMLGPKQKADFHSFWGRLFERYIGDLFRKAVDGKKNRAYIAPVFEGTNEELADLVIVCGRSVVLIECKGTTFTARAKYEGDYRILKQEIETKLIESETRPQAVKQLAKNIGRAFGPSRNALQEVDLDHVSTIFPVLITRDEIGGTAGVNGFLGSRFKKLLHGKAKHVSVTPLICMSSEIAEAICPYLSDTSLTDILGAHIRANHRGQARDLTMPFFSVSNSVLVKKGVRPIPDQVSNFDPLIELCLNQLGMVGPEHDISTFTK
jgi:hypothetical protein